MKGILAAILLVALLSAGCDQGGESYYETHVYDTPPARDGAGSAIVKILSPQSGTTLETVYRWGETDGRYGRNCRTGFTVDTTFNARVICHPAALTAQVFAADYNGVFAPMGQTVYPMSDTFYVPLTSPWNRRSLSLPSDSTQLRFFIQGIDIDSANWISETVVVWVSPRTDAPRNIVPDPPVFDEIYESTEYSVIFVRWCNQSPFVDSVRICYRMNGTYEPTIVTARASESGVAIVNYYPWTSYEFWLTAGNSAGWSPPSESVHLSIHDLIPPNHLSASSSSDGIVYLSWQNNSGWCTGFEISRHDNLSEWTTVGHIAVDPNGYPPRSYTDSTATRQHLYFYRIGVTINSGTFWSEDSVGVWVR
jgi:hypothetical protein